MTLDRETKEALQSPLESTRIKSRQAGFGPVDYLPAHDVLRRANEIFGYDGWSGRIVELEHEFTTETSDGKWTVVYRCSYEVCVADRSHQDVGVGVATRSRRSEAIENAIKFAVSDGIKRALRAWGDQFGLSLYADQRQESDIEDTEELSLDLIRQLISRDQERWPPKKVEAPATQKQVARLQSFWKYETEKEQQELNDFLSSLLQRNVNAPEDLNRVEAGALLHVVFNREEELKQLISGE